MDPALEGQCPPKAAKLFAALAVGMCSHVSGSGRFSKRLIRQVVLGNKSFNARGLVLWIRWYRAADLLSTAVSFKTG